MWCVELGTSHYMAVTEAKTGVVKITLTKYIKRLETRIYRGYYRR